MVLTEAFAAGTPVVASDIAGYRDVVRDGVDGVLVPRGDADRARRGAARPGARPRAPRARSAPPRWRAPSATPGRASPREVLEAYEDAIAVGAARRARRAAARPCARRRCRPTCSRAARRGACRRSSRRAAAPRAPAPGARVRAPRRDRRWSRSRSLVGLASSRSQRIGLDRIGDSLLHATPSWVLVALGLMCASMAVRAVSWHAILRAALPAAPRPRLRDALQGTMIGVLMSATLPARLGEPARAMIVARRIGRAARGPAGRARHDRLADAAEHPGAGDPRAASCSGRSPVFHHHESGADRVRGAAAGDPRRRAGRAGAAAQRRPARRARVRGWAPGAARRRRRCARALRSSATRGWARSRSARSCSPGSSSGCPATCCWCAFGLDDRAGHRRRGGGAVRGQRVRGPAGDAVQPRRLPGRVRVRAAQGLRRSASRTRSATASSCRPSRSRPPS